MTQIYGAKILSDYYNNATGAIYCDNANICKPNHAVSIIGWNDNYDTSNFNSKHIPSSKGAWIIRKSWGEKQEYDFDDLKIELYEAQTELFHESGQFQ